MNTSQSKNIPQGLLDKPELGTLAPVAQPTKKWGGNLMWSKDEDDLLRIKVPDFMTSFIEIQKMIPWRTFRAVLLRSSRLGLKAEYPEEFC